MSYPFNLCASQLRFTWIEWVHVVQGGAMVLPMDLWQIRGLQYGWCCCRGKATDPREAGAQGEGGASDCNPNWAKFFPKYLEQECIAVGCLLPACRLYVWWSPLAVSSKYPPPWTYPSPWHTHHLGGTWDEAYPPTEGMWYQGYPT